MFDTQALVFMLPEITILTTACILLLVEAYYTEASKSRAYYITQLGICVTWLILWHQSSLIDHSVLLFEGHVQLDRFGYMLKMVSCPVMLCVMSYSHAYNSERAIAWSEYYVLVLFAFLGFLVMASANHLLSLYMGLELISLPMYTLIAIKRDDGRGAEAAMKYFVMGGLASGLFLYGVSLIYGLGGGMTLHNMNVPTEGHQALVFLFAMVLMLVAISFKWGVAPFHMWMPDSYEGAPTSVTILLGTMSKLTAFAMFTRLFLLGFGEHIMEWKDMLMGLALVSIILGNLFALTQNQLRRILAYATVAHMGYMMLGFTSGTYEGKGAALFYIVVYILMTAAVFGIIMLIRRDDHPVISVKDLSGLYVDHPWLAFMLAIIMFSMAGVPPFVGFEAKWFVVQNLITQDQFFFAAVALVMSVVGAYYYIRIVKFIYFNKPSDGKDPFMNLCKGEKGVVAAVNTLLVLVLGVFPAGLLQFCQSVF